MNNQRRLIVKAGIVGIASSMSGCITQELFSEREYKESVSTVLLSQDGNSIVVITEKYHYIFDNNKIIRDSVLSPIHKDIVASFGTFTLETSMKISGKFNLSIPKNASNETKDSAKNLGYQTLNDGSMEFSGVLVGKRYDAKGIKPLLSSQKLNKSHKISVSVKPGAAEYAAQIAVSPITVAADGTLMLAGAALTVAGFAILLIVICVPSLLFTFECGDMA